ncbi:MAG: hypothetical protein H6R45_505 [Proteobacteria bacterium]|nr:hypothetical protein [Pseudomonadota bacterium]
MGNRILALLPLAVLLASCWQSSGELISYDAADTPSVAGSYLYTAEGTEPTSVRISAASDRYFNFTGTDRDGAPYSDELRFDRLKGAWYLVHSIGASGGDTGTYYYRILKIGDRTIDEFDPGCDESDDAYLGVSEQDGDCTFAEYEGLRDAAMARADRYDRGETHVLSYIGSYAR